MHKSASANTQKKTGKEKPHRHRFQTANYSRLLNFSASFVALLIFVYNNLTASQKHQDMPINVGKHYLYVEIISKLCNIVYCFITSKKQTNKQKQPCFFPCASFLTL